jgi:hypothetical protein
MMATEPQQPALNGNVTPENALGAGATEYRQT